PRDPKAMAPSADYNSIAAFHAKLARSRRILAVCGAGLSAASGLPTFRGAGGLWRNYDATELATPEAFEADPGLVWMFYAYRRHMALQAKPNPGHYALAALARKNPDFLCLTQNVDNLHSRAGHPPEQLHLLHGSLFTIKCDSPSCSWTDPANFDDPFCPALAAAAEDAPASPDQIHPLLDPNNPLPPLPPSDLPHCPQCRTGLQRPGVVWFGEPLSRPMLDAVNAWIARDAVDVVLVIGTSSVVYPAAGFAEAARAPGGRTSVVTVNLEIGPGVLRGMREEDFAFEGDAAVLLPKLLAPVIGDLEG
ncbi:SIR2 family histone deacetylase-like protein, partial [Thermothielavioides terrestris NRRL 8126]